VRGLGVIDLLPDVVQIVALAQSGDNCQTAYLRQRGGGAVHNHQMVHGYDGFEDHRSSIAKLANQDQKAGFAISALKPEAQCRLVAAKHMI
jgi:hypothetical protein